MLTYQLPEITIRQEDAKPVYQQIADAIIKAIEAGQLNETIPIVSSRQLASSLNVHRKTVMEAYERLIAQGWLYTLPAKGTYIRNTRKHLEEGLNALERHETAGFSFRHFDPPKPLPNPGKKHWDIRFDDGVPDPGLAYIKQFMLSYVRAFIQRVRLKKLEMFENPIEHPDALEELNKMLNAYRGFSAPAERHCFIFGNNISLYLVSQVLFEEGDTVLVENPGNPQAWEVFKRAGVNIIPVEVDKEGIKTGHIRNICRKESIKAVYVTPSNQYPTTVTMSQKRRTELLELADEYSFAIIEADYDYEFWYGEEPARALIADDPNGNVIFLGCLSRMLPPFNFIGFVVGPSAFMSSLRALWSSMGHQGDAVLELALLGFMKDGNFMRYARKSSIVYKEKRLNVADLLNEHLGDHISFIIPQGGLAFYIQFNSDIDIEAMIKELYANDIYIQTPIAFSFTGRRLSAFRFGFASLPVSKIEKAIRKMSELIPLFKKDLSNEIPIKV